MRLAITAWSLFVLGASSGFADGFTFTIGSPVAAQDFRAKSAAFVFRTGGAPIRPSHKSARPRKDWWAARGAPFL